MTLSSADWAELVELFRALTPGHVSSIVASLREPGSLIGTVKGSANAAFLQKLAQLGLATEFSLPEEVDAMLRETSTTFTLSAEAAPTIQYLLSISDPDRR